MPRMLKIIKKMSVSSMMDPRQFLAFAICAVAIVTTLCIPRAGQAGDGYTLGVVPFLPPVRLEERHGHFASALSLGLGRHIEFRTRSTFEAFRKEIEDQTFDIILVQPFNYVVAADQYGYLPLARANESLTAVIMVTENSDLKSLRDLKHKVLAMPPMSAAVSRLSRAALSEIGLKIRSDLTMTHLRTYSACLQAVLIGEADACATKVVSLRVFQSSRNLTLRTLAETESIPHVLFAVHERVPRHDRDVMRRTIFELSDTATGREALKNSGWLKGFVAAKDEDYDIVRSMTAGLDRE